jgi:two-component system NtrC family response regulator
MGKVEVASGGTLFLDEIGDMPMPLQAKMLRFLQERVIERVGGRKEIPVDVRVVCATNQNPEDLIKQGLFREDLFYRVSEITINIPPYRDREEGRLILARTLLTKYAELQKRAINGFSDDAVQAIEAYAWPGNVRELENKIKGAVKAIRVALTKSYGNISKAADLLGVTRPTLYDLLNKYGLSADSYSKKTAS